MPFHFDGQLQSSKSIFNRSLIVQSFNPKISVIGDSEAEDVLVLKKALGNLMAKSFDCKAAGTAVRFLTSRLSRQTGSWEVTGTERLMQRPQAGLIHLLTAMGVQVVQKDKSFMIESKGWLKPKSPLENTGLESSQFLSSIVLSSWNLDFDLEIQTKSHQVSQGYLDLTLGLVKEFGMALEIKGDLLSIKKHSQPKSLNYQVELDMSSAFVIATLGVFLGGVAIQQFPLKSLQPDSVFLEIFNKMQIHYKIENQTLKIFQAERISPIDFNLKSSPDLFPVLLILCAHAQGNSKLSGAPHLKLKESNRWEKGQELLKKMSVEFKINDDDEIIIYGKGLSIAKQEFKWNPDLDHRWAFAAGILKKLGWRIDIENPEVVTKSFPDFWDLIGLKI